MLPTSTIFAISITLSYGINVWNITNSTCENDASVLCANDAQCAPILAQYLSDCAAVLNQTNGTFPYSENYCPSSCQQSLNAYLAYVYPNEISTDFCQCKDESWYVKYSIYFFLECTNIHNFI